MRALQCPTCGQWLRPPSVCACLSLRYPGYIFGMKAIAAVNSVSVATAYRWKDGLLETATEKPHVVEFEGYPHVATMPNSAAAWRPLIYSHEEEWKARQRGKS